ncbi:MAG: hypothetical protein A2636_05905 [Elusimicrobia bacterium RIFCSPHIGHO2_01_FULL_64_10]|nr:MAG: hypothetical protein A2636_05905 [Elusimicrobia bacterium RIFCSPHIGHO2_01_FULL_64_10]
MLSLSIQNCLRSRIGSRGIAPTELKKYRAKLEAARKSLEGQRKSGRLGFFELPYNEGEAGRMEAAAREWKGRYDNFVVIGIGGSALGNIALQSALRHPNWNLLSAKERRGGLRLFVPDNVDPNLIRGLLDALDVKKTVFNVVSKSGTTAECLANYFILRRELERKAGKDAAKKQIVFTTDPEKGYLREVSRREGIPAFDIPANVGGRFSVLSPVGLLSAAATGISVKELLRGARTMAERCRTSPVLKDPASLYALVHHIYMKKGSPIHVMMPYSHQLRDMADWFRQLWAESLGKKLDRKGGQVFAGPTPVKALGVTDQHSQVQLYMEGPHDKVITFLSVKDFGGDVAIPARDGHYLGGKSLARLFKAEERATIAALSSQGRPNLAITLPKVTEESVGELIFMLELSTAIMGELMDINAFDQPGVEQGKLLTYALMGRKGFGHHLKSFRKWL